MVVAKSTTEATKTSRTKKNVVSAVAVVEKESKSTKTATTTTTTSTTTKKVDIIPIVVPTPTPVVVENKPTQKEYERPIAVSSPIAPVVDTEWFDMEIKSGGSFTKIPPILIDSSNLLLSNNNTIKIYNPTTGGLKSETSLQSNNDSIRYIASTLSNNNENGKNYMTVYLSTEMGKFYNYNIKNKEIEPIKTSNKNNNSNTVQQPGYGKGIAKFVISPNNLSMIYFLNNDGELCKFNENSIKIVTTSNNDETSILKNLQFISISSNGKYLVLASKSLIQVLNLSNTNIVSSKYYKSEYQITSLSVLPTGSNNSLSDLMISFGTTLGRLNFINYNGDSNQLLFNSYTHWHSTPLISSYFNYDGTMLFTGGYENTLAIWSVSNMRKKVLPRLGGAIVHINCDPLTQLLAVTLSNNKVQIINISDNKSCSIITGLQDSRVATESEGTTTNAANQANKITSFIEPISNNLIFSGQKNGVVQFYNIKKDRVEKEIIVSPIRNTDISTKKSKGKNLDKQFNHSKLTLEQSTVEPLAFHPTKPLFVSFESFSSNSPDKIENKVVLKDQILKFWETNTTTSSTAATTEDCKCVFSITTPHSSNILSMSFHPTKNILLTTSEKDFKIWKKQSMEAIDGITNVEKFYWTCIFEGSYRGLVCSASAFSKDGSIFAVACDHLVTLWDSESMSQLDILSFSSRHIIHELSFLNNNNSSNNQLLVSYKENGAIVWDLKNKSPIKVYTFPIKPISVCDEYYVLCPKESRDRLMIFSVSTHQLLFTTQVPIPKSQVIEQVLFSKDNDYDCIICITNDSLIYGYSTFNKKASSSQNYHIQSQSGSTIPSSSGIIKQSIKTQQYIKSKREKRQRIETNNLAATTVVPTTTTTTTTTSTTTTATESAKDESIFIGKEIFTKLPSTTEMFGAASHIMPGVQNIYQKYMDSILVSSSNLTTSKQQPENNNININSNNSNTENEENNVKKQPENNNNNSNKFSSMKNFFDNLEEEEEEPMETTPSTTTSTTTSATTASSASAKETKTKSTSSSVKKRKGSE